MEITESSLGLKGRVKFVKADNTTPAKIDGNPKWDAAEPAGGGQPVLLSAEGNPVATITVNPSDPFEVEIKPLPVPDSVAGPTHSAQGRVSADGDLDAGEERVVEALYVVTVRRDEAQSASVELTEITPAPTPEPEPTPS